MRKIIILLLCCGLLVSMVGCGGKTAPPPIENPTTTASKTVITEPLAETTPPKTAAEPTEKEKEPLQTANKDQTIELTVIAIKPITTQPKEEPKHSSTTKPLESSAAEITESKKETPPKAEEKQEEIYVGIQWPEVDPADIERLVVEKVNAYRIAQGDTAATMLPGLTEVARYRANELTTNFEHRGEQHVSTELNMDSMLTLLLMVCPMTVITKDTVVKLLARATGSVLRKVYLTESQTDSIIAKSIGHMSVVPKIHTSP